jgi:hypothetical protein
MEAEKGLSRLARARLTSVQFVLNYLILGFDERGALTTLVWPELLKKGEKYIFGMDQYRNELCSLIECIVETVSITHDAVIMMRYNNGVEMRIPLQSYQGHGERAILTGPKHYLLVL